MLMSYYFTLTLFKHLIQNHAYCMFVIGVPDQEYGWSSLISAQSISRLFRDIISQFRPTKSPLIFCRFFERRVW